MKNKVINCILFDFDGVLIDSLPAMEIAWESVQNKFGILNTFVDYKKYIGLPFDIKFATGRILFISISFRKKVLSS